MKKITYKEFEKIITETGYQVVNDRFIYVVNNNGRTIASVSKTSYKELNLNWPRFTSLTHHEKNVIGDACWMLASTPLEDREGPKYYLKVSKKIIPMATEYASYLNVKRDGSAWQIIDKTESEDYQTKFTAKRIKELGKVLDLTLFERVEVEED